MITTNQRQTIALAAARSLPFALWRGRGETEFTALVSLTGTTTAPVFGATHSGFAVCPFRTEDGSRAEIIPADILVRDAMRFHDGSGWSDTPATDAQGDFLKAQAPVRTQIAASGTAPACTAEADYQDLVARAVATIKAGEVKKIVLSRADARPLAPDHDLVDMAEVLADLYPTACVALFHTPAVGCWIVATPEVLLSADSAKIETMALAGTQWPEAGTDPETLDWPAKIVEEQGLVAEYIRVAFAQAGIANVSETAPGTVQAGHLFHLRSDFEAPLAGTSPEALGQLLDRLHPTSAVCGMPKDKALAFLDAGEGYDRTAYTGYFGPVAVEGLTKLYVNLRSARVSGSDIYLHVGGGIVADSVPETEWQETVQKARIIGRALDA
ncbi:chorismate-binding protein [Chachezhania sediminis]|uniref:chorismate-binding protein n=1 Tax=Chachezhania sediminis TaxID=2599291 RepID=UPI00131C670B|nr:chorismate-binding protein [Chachezhania sediminis]